MVQDKDKRNFYRKLGLQFSELGFTKIGNSWSRKNSSLVEIIEIDKPRLGAKGTIQFRLLYGLISPEVLSALWHDNTLDKVDVSNCLVSDRAPKDLDWFLCDHIAKIENLESVILSVVIPEISDFFENLSDLDAVLDEMLDASIKAPYGDSQLASLIALSNISRPGQDMEEHVSKLRSKLWIKRVQAACKYIDEHQTSV